MQIHCEREFGELGMLMDTYEYPLIEEVDHAIYDPDADKHGFIKKQIEQKIQVYLDKMARLESDKVKMFGLLYGQLSRESEAKLHEVSEWSNIYKASDPKEQ